MRTLLLALTAASSVAIGYFYANGNPAEPAAPKAAPVPKPQTTTAPTKLVAHEWGTFTSFSGSDGYPVAFTPRNTDLPNFVYYPVDTVGKGGRFRQGGLVSMETPVVYFYADREMKLSVKVDFPKGWITEWYPFAPEAPKGNARTDKGGQSIRWDVKLTPGEPERFPTDKNVERTEHYYLPRDTDATPLQTEVVMTKQDEEYHQSYWNIRGGRIVQHEKFLFYRGVGSFAPPVTVQALGGDKVRVVNNSGGKATGLVLVIVHNGKVGFKPLSELESGATAEAVLPTVDAKPVDLGTLLVKNLTAAGLYEKEAKAMVATWDDAWFREEGSRLLYLVPRAKTDELLPITLEPKPTELVRVLVGRHDFLTPEQEATAEKELLRARAAQAELDRAYTELHKIGRFRDQAVQIAEQRIKAKPQK